MDNNQNPNQNNYNDVNLNMSFTPPGVNNTPPASNTGDDYVNDYVPPQEELRTKDEGLKMDNGQPASQTPVNNDLPPVVSNQSPVFSTQEPASTTQSSVSQKLEDQNIFFLLGVEDGTDEEKEAFLDELQQVIWEDFLDNDLELLVTEEEMVEVKKIMAQKDLPEEEMQNKLIEYLEKLIPDLEEILLEKALELKEDMVRERIAGMKEYYVQDQMALDKIKKAEDLFNDGQWAEGARGLNSIQA